MSPCCLNSATRKITLKKIFKKVSNQLRDTSFDCQNMASTSILQNEAGSQVNRQKQMCKTPKVSWTTQTSSS